MERKLHFSCITPKTTFYNSNGTGRDSYIAHDSGGYMKSSLKELPRLKPNGFRYKDSRNYHSISKNNNITHYRPDGSGRDQYIHVNEGGLSYPYESKNYYEALFSNSLRSYHKSSSSIGQQRDFFGEAQRCKTAKEVVQHRVLKVSQRDLISRLTSPRNKGKCPGYRAVLCEN